jgi:hypothetical protein
MFRITCIAVLLFAAHSAAAQSESPYWWSPTPEDPNKEWGELREIKGKHLVFVNVAYASPDSFADGQQERDAIRRMVTLILSSHKDFEIVSIPGRAQFAINISVFPKSDPDSVGRPENFAANLDPDIQIPMEVAVVVRGAQESRGHYRPRIVWEFVSANVRGNPGPAAAFAIDCFMGQLRKLREIKK